MHMMRRRIGLVFLAGLLLLGWLAACTPTPTTAPAPTTVPTSAVALTWHREGELAEFCDDLTISTTGEATARSCRGEQPAAPVSFTLDAGQMAKLTAWLTSFQPFQYTWREPAQADGMTVEVNFTGTGAQTAMEPDQALIVDFAQNLYNEGRMGAGVASALCATPPAEQQLWVETAQGYCLHYPATYSLIQSTPASIEIVVDTVMNHVDPRASLTVEAANGRSLTAIVEQMIAEFVQPGQTVDRHDLTLDGLPAVMLDNLLGQDVYRRVVAIQNERLYSFFFSPIGEAGTATRDQAETLYQTVIDSFRFLEVTATTAPNVGGAVTPAPLPMPVTADVVTSTVPYIQALVDVNMRSGPGTNYGIVGNIAAGQMALVTGAMADGSWWRVICPDDSVGNCFVINDPSLTQPATAPGNPPTQESGDDPTGTTATYQDDTAGFAFDYHAPAWTIGDTLQIGPRSYVVQMSFSAHAPEETGETYLEVAVMNWDPKHDLAGYVAVRKQAWAASGMPIVDEETRTLAGGQPAMRFLVNGADGATQAYFLITTVGEQYLVFSGAGNLDALDEVAQTLRISTP